jgi:predicted HicB family RNase H-like nuclease
MLPPIALMDDKSRETVEAFIATARVHQERAIIDVLSELTAIVNADATDTAIHLEYESKQLVLAIDHFNTAETDELARMNGDPEKITIRLPAQLKEGIDQAANARGVSLNTWCLWTLATALSRHQRRQLAGQTSPLPEGHRGRRGRRRDARLQEGGAGKAD